MIQRTQGADNTTLKMMCEDQLYNAGDQLYNAGDQLYNAGDQLYNAGHWLYDAEAYSVRMQSRDNTLGTYDIIHIDVVNIDSMYVCEKGGMPYEVCHQ